MLLARLASELSAPFPYRSCDLDHQRSQDRARQISEASQQRARQLTKEAWEQAPQAVEADPLLQPVAAPPRTASPPKQPTHYWSIPVKSHGQYAFTDERTLPISHCVFCYRKFPPCDLIAIRWKEHFLPSLLHATRALQVCKKCFSLEGNSGLSVCLECRASFKNGKLPKACSVNNMHIGCEQRYPEELIGLPPVEERLIALQSAFGYITKFTVDNKTRSGISYRKHVKGHIIMFPNKVKDLVATVLPHPLLRTIENIHVSWSGTSKPSPADVGHLLQVRKSRVRAALSWLQRNNPLYEHTAIDHDEISSWHYAEGSSVPTVVMESMQREEPSAMEKTATDHIVPDADRGLEENGFTSIEELLSLDVNRHTGPDGDTVYATSSSGMFPVDGPAVFDEADKLSFLAGATQTVRDADPKEAREHCINVQTTEKLPFIRVKRGADFAVLQPPYQHAPALRMSRRSFEQVEQVCANLTLGQLKRAGDEMRETGFIIDPDIMLLLYKALHPQTPRLQRGKGLLADLGARYDRIALSIMDPGRPRISFGSISHYYATMDTNDRGSLHLHGLLWLDGNMQLPSLIDDMANPDEREYRTSVVRYINSVFHECLDEEAGNATRQDRKPIHPVGEMMNSSEALTSAFENESNYIAYCCQVHSHTYTCIQYSLKELAQKGANRHRRTACRFKAPWKIVEWTGFTEDGLLEICRNHPLVNRYNKAMAVDLRHNHDISLILTKTKGLAMVFYITNYATKMNTPMWKRLALAAEVLQQRYESGVLKRQIPDPTQSNDHRSAVLNETRQFLMRVANRVFSGSELSAVKVCYHLLGYHTDFTNVPNWSFLHLVTLYWAIFRRWPHLRRLAGMETDTDEPPKTVNLREQGRTLSYFEAYAYGGELLQNVCFYDYISMISLIRRKDQVDDGFHISLEGLLEYRDWAQKLRRPHEYAVPIFQGFISSDHKDEQPEYFKRSNSILHLALFVPWEDFPSRAEGDITDIWSTCEATLSQRLRLYVSNISHLSKSAEDARKDAKLWASRSEGDDTVDIEFPAGEGDHIPKASLITRGGN
ncbi:uncharacterized protein MKZ38_000723 [Zalerion maritima]|uniref:DUF6570 domain-containing protein n=1 Tax=Zalerion maritima TaxID=339359 RepID=A0AAD5WMN2_9PEZI|nr:uncharacterized protein MKZ38_000723 [Zalerion maritima]